MSLAVDKLPVTLIEDDRLTFPEWSMPARFGGSAVNYSQMPCSGPPGQAGPITFLIKPNNPTGSVIAPTLIWYTACSFSITVQAGGAGNLVQPGVGDAPRAYPMTSCCDNLQVNINGVTLDFPYLSMIGHALRRFNPRSALYKAANFCPWMPDNGFAAYESVVNTARNPLAAVGVGDFDFTRGAYQRVVYTPGGAPTTEATVTLETWEPVNITPFMYDMHGKGIPYIETLGLTFTMSNLHRALSHAVLTGGGANVAIPNNAVTGNITASTLYYQQINLPQWARDVSPVVKLPIYRIQVNPSSNVTPVAAVPVAGAAPPTGTPFVSSMITFSEIPSRIYVFAQPTQASLTMGHPDFTYMYCGGLVVNWQNQQYMIGAQREQLYTSAVDAGYAFPWENFNGTCVFGGAGQTTIGTSGSIICLRPGIDFPLEAGQAVGQAVTCNLQISANFLEQRAASSGPGQLWVVGVLPGVLTLNSKFDAQFSYGVISSNDVLAAADKLEGDMVGADDVHNSFGSGMFDSIKNALPILKRIGRYAHSGLSAAKDAGLLGEGVTSGGAASLYGGSALSGGARLTQAALAARRR